jgi:anti-sigma regulatory factor (Ser/Thr protein kinase)
VIVIAHTSVPEKVLRALREGAFAYFSRPFTVSALAAIVESALAAVPIEGDVEVLSAISHWLAIRLRCKRVTADRVLQFVQELTVDLKAPERENFVTALREILSNAIEHGGHLDPTKKTAITYLRTSGALLCYVRDPGEGFSFHELMHAAVSNPAECPFAHAEVRQQLGMRPGGFGILLARQFVDELIYNEKGNEALLIKYLSRK